jgi:hypothetical protein
MAMYRKRDIFIDATQWLKHGDHPKDEGVVMHMRGDDGSDLITECKLVKRFADITPASVQKPCQHCGVPLISHGWIDTLEGGPIVCPGDYIVKGGRGERYLCKAETFEALYQRVSD